MRDLSFDLVPGEVKQIAPGVRAVVAGNAGLFTFKGTVTYIVGQGQVAIVDPGPDDPAHIAAILSAVRNETATHIFVTHTHRDHSCASLPIKTKTGALVLGGGPHRTARPMGEGEFNPLDDTADFAFRPDVTLSDMEIVSGPQWTIEAVATPGHTANHMAYALKEGNALFSGDHVMAWSASIVAPPDGLISDYMSSLRRLQDRPESTYFPGHGAVIRNVPVLLRAYIRHRQRLEASITQRLSGSGIGIPALVSSIYGNIDSQLANILYFSVLAHLDDLADRGLVVTEGPPTRERQYRLAQN
jgi:glyoxylase-like metal-dependent hydrolase (beta-lactamase superfamily II)